MLTQLQTLVALYDRTDQDADGDLSAADFLECLGDTIEEARKLLKLPRVCLGGDTIALRVICGEDVSESPDLFVERTENGWQVFVHPDDGDPAGCLVIEGDRVEWKPDLP